MGGFRTLEAYHLVRTTSIYSCLKKFLTRAILKLILKNVQTGQTSDLEIAIRSNQNSTLHGKYDNSTRKKTSPSMGV